MKRLGIIGYGRIGRAVADGLQGNADWTVAGVLTRKPLADPPFRSFTETGLFLAEPYDLVIDTAGPEALHRHGLQVLSCCDLWSISAAALVDDAFRRDLAYAAVTSRHQLRLLGGAMAGLDGIAALAASGAVRLEIVNQRPGLSGQAGEVFSGSLREAARLFPHEVNAAVAVALAGPGIDATRITLRDPGAGGEHRLGFSGDGAFGTIDVDILIRPLGNGLMHPVAASILAALKGEVQPIRVG